NGGLPAPVTYRRPPGVETRNSLFGLAAGEPAQITIHGAVAKPAASRPAGSTVGELVGEDVERAQHTGTPKSALRSATPNWLTRATFIPSARNSATATSGSISERSSAFS